MNARVSLLLLAVIVLALGAYASLHSKKSDEKAGQLTGALESNTGSFAASNEAGYAGEISKDASGSTVYSNSRYGFRISYSNAWSVESDILGEPTGGMLQLVNYDWIAANEKDQKSFTAGQNRIDIGIGTWDVPLAYTSAEFPASIVTSRLKVAGQDVLRADVTSIDGIDRYRVYKVPLKNQPGQTLDFIIRGDPINFNVLDDIVRNITWI